MIKIYQIETRLITFEYGMVYGTNLVVGKYGACVATTQCQRFACNAGCKAGDGQGIAHLVGNVAPGRGVPEAELALTVLAKAFHALPTAHTG